MEANRLLRAGRVPLLCVAFSATAIGACGDESSADPDAGYTAPDATPHPTAPGFVQLREEFFSLSCASRACHGEGPGQAGLTFDDAATAYAHLVGGTPVNQAAADAELLLVAPGDHERSFLWQKLVTEQKELDEHQYGFRMPYGGTGAPGHHTLQTIRDWIDAGAPFEGQTGFEVDFIDLNNNIYVQCDAADQEGMRACFGEEPGDGIIRYYSLPVTIPANSELQLCTYLDEVTTETVSFKSYTAYQMPGGHHSAMYVAFQPEEPGLRECTGAAMTNLRILAGAFAGTDGLVPNDVRLELPAGRQVVLQSHYVNPYDHPITVMDAVDLTITTVEESPVQADSFVVNLDEFEIPANAEHYEYDNGEGCRVGREISVHSLQLHTHEYGTFMELVLTPEGEEPYVVFSDTDGVRMREGASAMLFDPPLELGSGDVLQARCEWHNPHGEPIEFPDEMCAAFMYYSPSEGFLLCADSDTEPSVLGAGDPGDGCVAAGSPGNALGVGEHCTSDGGECTDNTDAVLCLAAFDARANFCSMLGCSGDEDCGEGAVCLEQGPSTACVPTECAD